MVINEAPYLSRGGMDPRVKAEVTRKFPHNSADWNSSTCFGSGNFWTSPFRCRPITQTIADVDGRTVGDRATSAPRRYPRLEWLMPAALCAIMWGSCLAAASNSRTGRVHACNLAPASALAYATLCMLLAPTQMEPSAEGMLHSAEPAVERSAATGTNANTLSGALSLESISYGVAQQ